MGLRRQFARGMLGAPIWDNPRRNPMLHPLLLLPAPPSELLTMWNSAGTVARLVLIVLLLLSVFTWGLVIERWYSIRHARHVGARFSAAVTVQGNYVKAALRYAACLMASSPIGLIP